ncbi:MBL fold metallo-hydrolase [Paracoccus alkenifer]|uniref:Glyoxylase, beta-lactamase superfamily II n=1 Tax=Paracoccus alkenifer TaxID=65735 RepID=A0A1H6KBN1_9RHOB|nr:MBL fold metallo-hydrolase [Paracoccus alkenifer]SEH68863.1 Glyoxylase, beta-lactamase superfamily II [Paracoccus alkenifer]
MISRRLFVLSAAAGTILTGTPLRVWAGSTLDLGGGVRIDTLSDGHLELPFDFSFAGLPRDELDPILQQAGVTGDMIHSPCNITLLRDGTNTVLFDAGSGPDFMPTAGKVTEALAALDLTPEDVTHLLFTHGHPDHLWGVLDDFDEPLFANAAHVMGRAEAEYWTDPATLGSIRDDRQSFVAGASRRIEALGDALALIEDGESPLPGVTARLTPGHTAGHMSFDIDAGGQRVLVVGDAIANSHIAFARPEWESAADEDAALGARTRVALLGDLADSGTQLIGFHLSDGGIGRAERNGDSFRFVPG